MSNNPNISEDGKATQFPHNDPTKGGRNNSIRNALTKIMQADGELLIDPKNVVDIKEDNSVIIKVPTGMQMALKLKQWVMSKKGNDSLRAIQMVIDETDKYAVENNSKDDSLNLNQYLTKASEANPLYLVNTKSECRIRINRGGTRSGKTYSLSQIAIDWLLTGFIGDIDIPDGAFDVVRKTLPALKASVLKDILKLIRDRDLTNIINHHKTEKSFTIKGIDRTLNYFSVDDENKVRGSKRKILWANEADGLTFDDFRQLNMRGVIICFLDFNPSKYNTWIKEQLEIKRYEEKNDVEIITSTYKDNYFLTSDEVAEIEYLAKGNADFWKVFGTGQYAKLAGIVHPNWELYDKVTFDEAVRNSKVYTVGGMDFGIVNPSAIIKIHIDNAKKLIYAHEIAYGPNMSTDDLADVIKRDFVNIVVSCDNAEPRTIGELKKKGCNNAIKCPKKQIVSDIRRINGFRIIVREGSNNFIREIKIYHRPFEDGVVISEIPVDKQNHAMSGFRYGVIYGLNTLKI